MATHSGMKLKIQVEGLAHLQSQFDRLGTKFPKKEITRAAKLGSNDPLRDAKAFAPKGKTGLLKKGLHRKMETGNRRVKTVYRIRWNKKYSEDYLKKSSGVYGGKPPLAFYPHSQEYGFKTKYGYKRGRYFVTKAIDKNAKSSLDKIVKSLNKSVTDLLK